MTGAASYLVAEVQAQDFVSPVQKVEPEVQKSPNVDRADQGEGRPISQALTSLGEEGFRII